MKLCISVHV